MKDLHGQAILDFYTNNDPEDLIIHNNYGEPEEMPVEVFFRDEMDFSTLEHLALIESKGHVLDLGAGAGPHSLVLQSRGFQVSALENSPGCCKVMKQSGVKNVIEGTFQEHKNRYDTLLILMNGIGLAGKLEAVGSFLQQCASLLNPGGQILIDSSDIAYLYEGSLKKPNDHYYGEINYQYEYKGNRGDWFDWIYVDQETLRKEVTAINMQMEVLHSDTTDQFLARITPV